jgi:translocation and assembly module TamB
VDADVTAELGERAVSAAGAVAIGGSELASFRGSLGAAPEALRSAAALRAAPLSLDLTIPEGTLARVAGDKLPLTGTVRGAVAARGTLASPSVEASLAGQKIGVEGRSLGEVKLDARYASGRATAEVDIAAAAGGTLSAGGRLDAPLGLGADLSALGGAPVEVRLVAKGLGLGVLPALAPGIIGSASGRLDADVVAQGPLQRPSPRGRASIAGGRIAVSEWGEWSDLALDAEVTDDAVELRTLRARREAGRVEASGSLRGLASGRAKLEAAARTESLTLVRAGMPLATLDVETTATGSYADGLLDAEVRIPRGVVRLPDRLPRELQSVERRPDIVIGKPKEPRKRRPRPAAPASPAVKPLEVRVHAVAPDQLFVRSQTPRIDLELKADVTYRLETGESYMEGSVDVIRGLVEIVGGRTFEVQRGHVQFTGGPPTAALLDVQALYDNPAAKVTVVVSGPMLRPDIRLSSQPPMDEAQIAMFIATGRTELQPGAGGVENITGQEAGRAAVSALATQVFKNIVADKLPLDTVALDADALRAGKYVTDEIYVGYTRRLSADPEKRENVDEVRVEYRITPRWTFESRYGSSQSGGASLVWSKDY